VYFYVYMCVCICACACVRVCGVCACESAANPISHGQRPAGHTRCVVALLLQPSAVCCVLHSVFMYFCCNFPLAGKGRLALHGAACVCACVYVCTHMCTCVRVWCVWCVYMCQLQPPSHTGKGRLALQGIIFLSVVVCCLLLLSAVCCLLAVSLPQAFSLADKGRLAIQGASSCYHY
jgi:hypothetical protein